MSKSEKFRLQCNHCGHIWVESIENLLRKEIITVHRDGEESEKRRVTCPNCEKDVNVEIPAAWREL